MHGMYAVMLLLSVLNPLKTWFAPSQPVTVEVKGQADTSLVLTDFSGKTIDPKDSKEAADVSGDKTIDLKTIYPRVSQIGTYVLFTLPKGKPITEFVGTPLVIETRGDRRHGGNDPLVTKIEPLRYAVMQTSHGPITMAFYYDVAPNTVTSFLNLAEGGYFDKLTFHRILPGFVIQGGDPRGTGTGGPGYGVEAEFNDRPHEEGVLSMAREGDPNEASGFPPRAEYANSAGSQFFICLDYAHTKSLDKKYTAFGKVVDGMNAVKAIAATPLADPEKGSPREPQTIEKVEVKPVTAQDNPYSGILHLKETAEKAAPGPAAGK